jgi:hypothetical protein
MLSDLCRWRCSAGRLVARQLQLPRTIKYLYCTYCSQAPNAQQWIIFLLVASSLTTQRLKAIGKPFELAPLGKGDGTRTLQLR